MHKQVKKKYQIAELHKESLPKIWQGKKVWFESREDLEDIFDTEDEAIKYLYSKPEFSRWVIIEYFIVCKV